MLTLCLVQPLLAFYCYSGLWDAFVASTTEPVGEAAEGREERPDERKDFRSVKFWPFIGFGMVAIIYGGCIICGHCRRKRQGS